MASHDSLTVDCNRRVSASELPGYGEKKIGFKRSLCLVINNVMGPAMVALPLLNQQAGWFPCVFVTSLCCVCAAFSSTMLCEALQCIPGNETWDGVNPRTGQRYEFCDAVDYFWGTSLRRIVRIFFNVSLQAQNIAAMVVSCQVLDDFFRDAVGICWGVKYGSWPVEVTTRCLADHETSAITIGFLSCMAICIPFGFLNLEQNIGFQIFSAVCLIVLVAEFLCQFTIMGPEQGHALIPSRTPFATASQEKTLGVILFSYCFASTCPSWVNEKSHKVSCNQVIWLSAVVGLILKVVVGLFGAWAYELAHRRNQHDAQNILLVMDHTGGGVISVAAAYLFNFTTLIPGIPVINVIVRYNLISSGRFGPAVASFLAVVVPWLITMFLYRTALFVDILNWAAMLCMGPVNFVVPPLLYVSAIKQRTSRRSRQAWR
eukprot:gnl/MRDRNA2_/MRDRNA2_65667_c0_seq2.p1 gnl/MRDRNA2_/MRDRNA2_65667_c0~~gnl/MRDRNA2_/MRDRNA2_65667_c0_seq2.p1  ORF type:complete len:431 (+),score=51.60 gnl/MRDRNA2_/MRDRNA2_65667_c0_seq2:87-1379(+)